MTESNDSPPHLQEQLQAGQDEMSMITSRKKMRALQQHAEQAEVTVVATPQELLDAVKRGAQHVVINAHLDLTTVEPMGQFSIFDDETMTDQTIQSIRVRELHKLRSLSPHLYFCLSYFCSDKGLLQI